MPFVMSWWWLDISIKALHNRKSLPYRCNYKYSVWFLGLSCLCELNRIDEFFIVIFVYENAFEAMCHLINCLHNTSTASQELLQAIIYLSLLFRIKKVHEKGIISYAYDINFCKPVCKYEEELAVHLRIGIGRMWSVFHGTHAYASCFGSRLITLFIGRWFSLPNIMELVLQFILSRTVAIHAIGIRSR